MVAKLMYGLTSIPLSKADANNIDAFQMRGLRKFVKIKHPYWSRVFNKKLLEIAKDIQKRTGQELPRETIEQAYRKTYHPTCTHYYKTKRTRPT